MIHHAPAEADAFMDESEVSRPAARLLEHAASNGNRAFPNERDVAGAPWVARPETWNPVAAPRAAIVAGFNVELDHAERRVLSEHLRDLGQRPCVNERGVIIEEEQDLAADV